MPFTNPKKNVENFGIQPGFSVVDLGAGSGMYTIPAAKLVGEGGRVYAVDIQKELLSNIKKEASKENLFNVEVIWGDVEKNGGTRLSDNSIDIAIASNILFQLEDKETFLREIKRILKPGKGKVCVIDWSDSFGGLGPPLKDVVSFEMCKDMFLRSGFELNRTLSDVGAHHYGLIFTK